MLMNERVSRRLRFERRKNRHGKAWDFVTAPLLALALLALALVQRTAPLWVPIYCRWKRWR